MTHLDIINAKKFVKQAFSQGRWISQMQKIDPF